MAYRTHLRFLSAFSLLAAFAALAACSADGVSPAFDDAAVDDAGEGSDVAVDSASSDAGSDGTSQTDASDARMDTRPTDTTPPAQITLVATTTGLTSITLSWTAVGDDGTTGSATGYEIRQSLTPITNLTEFAAAAVVASPPTPAIAGTVQTKLVTGLTNGTAYHYAMRAHDEVPNQGQISADTMATTLPRAQLLVSEVAVSNVALQGFDFVELLAVTAGRIDGLVVKQNTTGLYTFGPLSVAAGDRIVVHAAGTPCPTGCSQEDVTGVIAGSTEAFATATAWDVYATPTATGLSGADNVVQIFDGAVSVDAVALSNRDGDAAVASMTAFAALNAAGGWVFGTPPVDGTTDCATQKDSVSIATGATVCGGQPSSAAGTSMQRNGTTDTNQRKDFFAAPQTMGLANVGNLAPKVVSAVPTSTTGVLVTFSEDIAMASVTAGAFTGLGTLTATLSDVNQVTLVLTAAQTPGAPYTLATDATVTDLQGTALVPASTLMCGYSTTPVAMVINEVAPNISYTGSSADLIELRVVTGGAMNGIVLRANGTSLTSGGTVLATLPNACVPAGDLIVVHLEAVNAPAGTLPSPLAGETNAKDQYAAGTYSGNYDGAWDFIGGTNNLVFSDTVITLVIPAVGAGSPTLLDAVALSNQRASACAPLATCPTSAGYRTQLTLVQAATHWAPACSASPCDDATLPNTAVNVAASSAGVGASPTTPTVARNTAGTDTNTAADWVVGPSTLGSSN